MIIPPLKKIYNGKCVLDFSGLDLESGKIYGVIGANGSGKSTFAKILAGVISSDDGKWNPNCPVGYMPQKNYAFRMSVKSNILLVNDDQKRAEGLMEALKLMPLSEKKATHLSGGETAKMALARVMMQDFRLLILDEPTAAMDIESAIMAESLISDYVKQTNCTLVLITHSLNQAKRVSDNLIFFYEGKMLETGTTSDLLSNPACPETKSFIDYYGLM